MSRVQYTWSTLLNDYSDNYSNAIHIITYLKSYPEVLEKIQLINLIDINEIELRQKNWIWLCSQYDNELERDFFKPYWIPLQDDSYDFFMDISNNNYPIFEVNYFFFKPYRWYVKYIVENISDLLLANDTGLDLHKLLQENEEKRWKIVDDYFAERRKLGLEGKY